MSKIAIVDLEVFFCVGVTDEERAKPQRLLLTVDMDFDFSSAAVTDRITKTIDYNEVAQAVLKLGEGRNWKLIEKVANDVADRVLSEFQPESVTVEVKKFTIPQARYVGVRLLKSQASPGIVKRAAWGIP
jgi:7,8-dihydroneopterin aldolase/epimerase/oxygenase